MTRVKIAEGQAASRTSHSAHVLAKICLWKSFRYSRTVGLRQRLAPDAPGVHVDYWVTVRASQQIPQLFSAVLRFPWAQSSARATAAVLDTPAPGSIYLINRECDSGPSGSGVDLSMSGAYRVRALFFRPVLNLLHRASQGGHF